MLSLSSFRSRLPSQICQRPVIEIVRSVWRGARSPRSSPQSGRDSFLAFSKSRTLIRRENLEQPSNTLCSLVGQGSPKERTRMAANDAPQEISEQAEKAFYFGKFKIDLTEVFLITQHSYAFVNLKPVVPGHILYTGKSFESVLSDQDHPETLRTESPRRVVHRFLDLTPEEVADLWLTAQRVGQKIEPFFKATSLTFAIQDGTQAGQTVPHVHIHILPRRRGDFENNDEVYDVIDDKEKQLAEKLDLDKERKDRTFDEMAAEAAELRALF